jgi:hypothetical protein
MRFNPARPFVKTGELLRASFSRLLDEAATRQKKNQK